MAQSHHSHAGGEKVAAARLSIISNTTLTLLKLAVGLLSGSVSVLSEAAHSAMDLLASWIAFFSVRVSDRPADPEHPYGHGKVESLSGMAEALLIFAAAAYIVYESVKRLRTGHAAPEVGAGLVVMGFSVLVNVLISRYLFRTARESDSLALEADAEHLRTDVYTSIGVFVGLGLVKLTRWAPLDAIVAMAVAALIMSAAWRLTRGALAPLMDAKLPESDVEAVKDVLDREPRVKGYHKLRTRKSGSQRYVDAHVMLDDHLTLLEAHDLTEELEDRVRRELPNAEVTLHTEPYHAERRHQFEHHGGPYPDEGDKRKAAGG